MATRKADDSAIYQLKVTLRGSKPPIWRRIQVRGSTTLYRLHPILQIVMGWDDSHLHQFIAGGAYYGVPDPDWGREVKNEQRVRVEQVVPEVKAHMVYEYDFGDSWEHTIVVEKVLPVEEGVHYPRCVKGKLACPPEDVGGIWGYYYFLEAIADPEHEEHESMMEWYEESFNPEAFDLEAVNRKLRQL